MKTFIFGLILGIFSVQAQQYQLYSFFITSFYIQIVYNSLLITPYAIASQWPF